jgi:hypothetical protein
LLGFIHDVCEAAFIHELLSNFILDIMLPPLFCAWNASRMLAIKLLQWQDLGAPSTPLVIRGTCCLFLLNPLHSLVDAPLASIAIVKGMQRSMYETPVTPLVTWHQFGSSFRSVFILFRSTTGACFPSLKVLCFTHGAGFGGEGGHDDGAHGE